MVSERLRTFLERQGVHYDVVTAPYERFTAQETAASLHLSGKRLAKVVMVKVGERLVMAVAPADEQIALRELGRLVGDGENVRLAREAEFATLFPDCDTGAMPPFGNLYNIPVYVDDRLSVHEDVYFEGGSHRDIVRMKYADFVRLVNPKVAHFGTFARAA